jgi:tRNA wybutosine-synthesizing protein 3
MDINKHFLISKENALKKLNKAYYENQLDEDIEGIVKLINLNKNYYTSSSCAGRIVIIELPKIGDKKEANFLGKWHREIKYIEAKKALESGKSGMIWLLAQSPILHIITKSNIFADNLIKIAISSGFKNSGIKSITNNIVIEICSTERLDSPIGENGLLFSSQKHFKLLINVSNHIIKRSRKKLKIFEKNLKKYL